MLTNLERFRLYKFNKERHNKERTSVFGLLMFIQHAPKGFDPRACAIFNHLQMQPTKYLISPHLALAFTHFVRQSIMLMIYFPESWIELSTTAAMAGIKSPDRITPLPFNNGEEYLRLLREAQRESNQSSRVVSLASSRRDTPRDSPKSPPNSPQSELCPDDELRNVYINYWTKVRDENRGGTEVILLTMPVSVFAFAREETNRMQAMKIGWRTGISHPGMKVYLAKFLESRTKFGALRPFTTNGHSLNYYLQ